MKPLFCLILIAGGAFAGAQQPAAVAVPAVDPLDSLAFMQGDWAGKQDFNTQGGPAMVGDATDHVSIGIAGKYLCEMLATTLPGRKATDTRHFISYDKASGHYAAWWFNDTSTHPTEFSGELSAGKLVLVSASTGPGPMLRATYESPAAGTLTFLLEMKTEQGWNKLFLTTYTRKNMTRQN